MLRRFGATWWSDAALLKGMGCPDPVESGSEMLSWVWLLGPREILPRVTNVSTRGGGAGVRRAV